MTLQHHHPPTRKNTNKPQLQILPAQREDMDMIAGFVRSTAEWYRPFLDEKDMAEHDVDDTWGEVNFRRRDFYVGYHEGKAVGTISLQYFGRHAYLGYIYLDSKQVGHGFGQQLMKFAERVARKMGMVDMILIAHPEAAWAKKAYLKYGFEIIHKDREDILNWEDGVMRPYYEEGFELYRFEFSDVIKHYQADDIRPGVARA